MPNQNAFIGKIENPRLLRDILPDEPSGDMAMQVAVQFEDKRRGILDTTQPLAAVWARMIDKLQQDGQPVYVEIDPGTAIITNLYIPMATGVIEVADDGKEAIEVVFTGSQSIHHLRRDHEDFKQFFELLRDAQASGATLLVTANHDDFEIIDVRPLPRSFVREESREPLPPPAPVRPVSPGRAQELLDMMIACTCTPCHAAGSCIPFKYPADGCWIRAHLMCYLMVAENETPEKMWITGRLNALTNNDPNCSVGWGWHVAPTLMVTQAGGPDVKMVIDPSLSPVPLTPADWKALMRNARANLYPEQWEGYAYLASGTATQARADSDMGKYRLLLNQMCVKYGSSPYQCGG